MASAAPAPSTSTVGGRMPAWPSPPRYEGDEIVTIEGLGSARSASIPMQAAFLEKDAYQCGYCTSGQIMSAAGAAERALRPGRRRRARVHERQHLPLRRLRRTSSPPSSRSRHELRERTMQTFAFHPRRRRRPPPSPPGAGAGTAQQGASVRFLAGGTTLIDLMKLGVEAPEPRGRHQPPRPRRASNAQADGGLSIGATARNSDLAHHPVVARGVCRAVAGHPRRRLHPAPQCRDHRGQPAAAHALHVLPRPRQRPATSASPVAAARPSAALTACWRSSAPASTASPAIPPTWPWRCWPTTPSCMFRAPPATRQVPLAEFYLLPGDRPERENVLRARRPRHACHPAARRGRRARCLPQAARPRLLRVRARLGRGVGDDGRGADTSGALRARRRRHAGPGACPRRRRRSSARRRTRRCSGARPISRSRAPRPQSQNGFKIELARRCLVHALRQVTA